MNVAVLGARTMGHAIVEVTARAGHVERFRHPQTLRRKVRACKLGKKQTSGEFAVLHRPQLPKLTSNRVDEDKSFPLI